MANGKCEMCGARLPDKATACPGCGHPCHFSARKWQMALTMLVFTGALIWLWFFTQQNRELTVQKPQHASHDPVPLYHQQNVQIMEDRFRSYRIFLDRDAEITIDYEVKSGPVPDVVFLDEKNYSLWNKEITQFKSEKCSFYPELSSLGVKKSSRTHRVDPGVYYVVFDNTVWGPSNPPKDFKNSIITLDLLISKKY